MGFEERCDRDAKALYPQIDLLAMSARNHSWEPSPWLAAALMHAAADLASALGEYVPLPPRDEEDG